MNKLSENQFELERQLHEQYAINNNANIGSFVSFVVALLALFGFFGYAFVFSSNEFSIDGKLIKNGIMSLDVFFLFSIIVIGMLFFLSLVSIQLGYSCRSNQIIIDRIRNQYFGKNKKIVFGKSYSPLKKTWYNYVQDYFNLFYWMFFIGQIFVFLFTVIKIFQNIFLKDGVLSFWGILVFIVFIIHLGCIFLSLYCRSHYFVKYCKAFKIKITEKMIKKSCCIVRYIYIHKFNKNHKD
jgi:hypothetical protein